MSQVVKKEPPEGGTKETARTTPMGVAAEGKAEWDEDALSHRVIGLAIKVHRALGPGLLEKVYETALAYELSKAGIPFERQLPWPVQYETVKLDCGFRLDLWVARRVIVEVKAVEALSVVHEAQLLTYLRLTGCKLGLLLNFNVEVMRSGIKRVVNNL